MMVFHCDGRVMVVCLCMAILASPILVFANSGGLGIPCNVHPLQLNQRALGTANRQKAFLPGLPQTDENVVPMWWTLPPDWSDANAQRNGYTGTPKYTVRTADGNPAQDPTSYVPGQFIDIIVRTLEKDAQFTGLLMYAQKGTAEAITPADRVGEWVIPPRQNYQIDPNSGCITHRNADPKNYKSVFRVRFPPGSGTVTIKALVKVGLAFPEMQGAFFWPNTRQAGFLTLTEQTTNFPTISWYQGTVGQSCTEVCSSKGGTCDVATMRTVGGDRAQFLAATAKSTACFAPVMRGCGDFAPTLGTEGCFYSDSTCTRDPIRNTYDPCTADGVLPWTLTNPRQRYNPLGNAEKFPTCASHQGALWCARQFTDGEPSANNGAWYRAATCGSTSTLTLSFPTTPRSYAPPDCDTRRTQAQDGQRVCACSGTNQTPSTGTLPTQGIASGTVPPPPNNPTNTGTTTQTSPTTPSSPTTVATRAPTMTPTMASSDSLMIASFPRMIAPTFTTLTVRFTYSAFGARTIAADLLSSSFEYFGGGFVNVPAGSGGMIDLTLSITKQPPVGQNYMINYFFVDQAVYANGNNPQAWQQAIPLNNMPVGIMVTNNPIPSDAPTQEPDTTTTRVTPTIRPPGGLKNASSSSSTPSILFISLLAIICGTFHTLSSRHMMVVCVIGMIVLSSTLPHAEAHNWLTSPARSNRGTGRDGNFNGWTSPPCPPRSSRIHAQVATGQRFPVEWASGHGYGSSTYLIVVKTENEGLLKQLDERLMDAYLAEAPATPAYMADTKAWHVFPGGGQRLQSLDRDVSNDPLYKRPDNFRPYTTTSIWTKTAAATANDKRASYTNSKWPWIVAIHKFAMHEDRPDDMDGAFVEIPQGQTTGSYIVYYFWRGYYDCMDINVLSTTTRTADVFGSPVVPATFGVDRALHTTYPPNRPNYQIIGECNLMNEFDVIDNNNPCYRECTQGYNQQNDVKCQAIITVPVQLPNVGPFTTGTSHLPQKCLQRTGNVVNPKNTFVCYNVYGGTPPAVGPATKTVYDPEDPVFYHTAYLIRSPWKFADACTTCASGPPPIDWRFGDKCISCSDTARNLLGNTQPTWNFIDNCQHCNANLA